jgi:hypothetical protein
MKSKTTINFIEIIFLNLFERNSKDWKQKPEIREGRPLAEVDEVE